jgi:fatty acid-binding protein DegV
LANVINLSVEKSSSCRGEQLQEIGKLTANNKTPEEISSKLEKARSRAHICLEGVGV